VLVAELLERRTLSVREAVLSSGRHEQDVVACLLPLVRSGALARNEDGFAIASGAPEPLLQALRDGVEKRRDRLERDRFVRSRVLRGMIGVDPKMQLVFEAIRQVCRLDVPVLIIGETGTGKELVARALHELGPRRAANFEAVNCATLPTSLFESHMFGHARGAFTGADQEHDGIFERCNDGTVLLDELGELEVANQAKLLRVLQDHTFHRLGDNTARRSSFRLVAATHRDIGALVAEGAFREDLYYRCNVFEIRLPSLRERLGDLPYIVDALLATSTGALALTVPPTITRDALDALARYRWPGNVRELENVLLRAAIASKGEPIEREHVLVGMPGGAQAAVAAPPQARPPTTLTLAEMEREHIAAVLQDVDGNMTVAAQRLGIARASLYRKVRAHDIERPSASEPEEI